RTIRSPCCTPPSKLSCKSPLRSSSDEASRYDEAHDLVRSFENLMHAQIAHDFLDAELGQITVAAMQLQRLVGDFETGVGDEALGHGAKLRRIRLLAVERRRGAPQESARGFERNRHVGEAELKRLEFVEPLAEGLALFHVGERLVERCLRAAERARRDIEPPAIEPGHGDLEADAFFAEQVL